MIQQHAPLPLWTSGTICEAVGGTLVDAGAEAWSVTGVTIDSRTIAPGDLFIALVGERFDGHDFVLQALDAGAAGALVSRLPEGVPSESSIRERMIMVADTHAALNALGAAARARTGARIVGVTGSVGKTGTKEMLAAGLAAFGPSYATQGNLNNHFGAPLSLARMPASTAHGVFELGMNHAGEIAPLSRLVRPHVAVITTVEAVHIEFFDSVEGIADAKAEIFVGVEPGGAAILNRDNAHFARLSRAAEVAGVGRILSFGRDEAADFRLVSALPDQTGTRVAALISGHPVTFSLSLVGEHHALNAVAVLGAISALGLDVAAAAHRLADVQPLKGRGRRYQVPLGDSSFLLIDESYNASPPSMQAAITVLANTPVGVAADGEPGRRIAVLGDMLELGEMGPEAHASLSTELMNADIDLVFSCGRLMEDMHRILPTSMQGAYAGDAVTLGSLLTLAIRPGDVVLVKGSLGSRTGIIVDALVGRDSKDLHAVQKTSTPGVNSASSEAAHRPGRAPKPSGRVEDTHAL